MSPPPPPVRDAGAVTIPPESAPVAPAPRARQYRLAGDDIVFEDTATDADLAILDTLPHLKTLAFSHGVNARPPIRVTAAGLAHLRRTPHLEKLLLDDVPLTDDALAPIATLTELRELWLDFNGQLTDQ